MSLFLTRLAAHMNVRPAGVNLQIAPMSGNNIVPSALTSDWAVTSRTAEFKPAANTVVDLWIFTSSSTSVLSTPFKTDGTCNVPNAQITGVFNPCVLDVGDLITNGDGNTAVLPLNTTNPNTYDVYAWTGATGAKFDVDTTTYSMVTVKPDTAADGYTFKLDGYNDNGTYKFGTTATWVIQVTSADKPIAEAGWTFTLSTDENVDGVTAGQTGLKLKTDANGQVVITKSYSDPSTTATNTATFKGTITAATVGAIDAGVNNLTATWLDAAQVATDVVVSTPTEYKIVNNPAPTPNMVTALVTDQYGNPMSGVAVALTSNQAAGLSAGNTVTTGSDGKASIGYNWTVTTEDHEVITANAGGPSDTADFYWVFKAVSGVLTSGGVQNINTRDLVNKAFVANAAPTGDYTVWTWKAGDTYRVGGVLKSQADFETAIAKMTAGVYDYGNINVISYSTTGFSEFALTP
jgi:hypothetical protein